METYRMIGGDGREYGPATLDELRDWIRDGRLGKATLVWRSDLGLWQPGEKWEELEADLRQLYGTAWTAPVLVRAGFWPRLGAYMTDWLVLWLGFRLAWAVVSSWLGLAEPPPSAPVKTLAELLQFFHDQAPLMARQLAVYLPLHFLYDVWLNGKYGATVGKMISGLKIVRLDGAAINYRTAARRWLGARISHLLCYLGYLMVAFRTDKRGLHDLIAQTQVIYHPRS